MFERNTEFRRPADALKGCGAASR